MPSFLYYSKSMNIDALLTAASAKSDAHSGLSDALETGRVSAVRINGDMHLFARDDDRRTFELIFGTDGRISCRGHFVSSTNRDLARDTMRAALDRGPHTRG